MGWKLAVVISRLDGHELEAFVDEVYRTPQILKASDVDAYQALYPPDQSVRYALAHEGFGWIIDWRLIERVFGAHFSSAKPLSVAAPAWTFVLHSVVNGYGFAEQRGGAFVRCRAGDGDGGVTLDIGTASAAERGLVAEFGKPGQEALAWEAWCDAERSVDGEFKGMSHDGMGEDVVFGLMNELVGFRIDVESQAADAFSAARVMTIERPKRKSLFGWLSR